MSGLCLAEERAVRSVLERVQKLESVADGLDAEQAGVLREVVAMEWDAAAPVRPRVAASILGLSEKTVRAWVRAGLLTVAVREPRMLLDPERLLTVLRLVRDSREAGRQRRLLDKVWCRISDTETLGRADLRLRTQARRAVLDFDMLTSAAIAQALGGHGRNQREIASRLRSRGVLLGLRDASRRGYLYPAFQVDAGNERVHPVVAEINRHLDAARDPWGVGSWWVSAHPRLDGAAPMDLVGTDAEADLLVMNGLSPVTDASDVRAVGR